MEKVNPSDLINDRIIWRERTTLEPYVIPEGSTKCPDCKGLGKVIKIYRDPGPNEYMRCFKCDGKGYLLNSLSEDKQR